MPAGDPASVEFGATVLTSNFQITREASRSGLFLEPFINDEQKTHVDGLRGGCDRVQCKQPGWPDDSLEVMITKRDAAIIGLDAMPPKST